MLSQAVEIKFDVPQGSVVKTLLFLAYINDIRSALRHSKIRLFADDTLVFVTGKDVEGIINVLIMDLNELSEWIRKNNVKLNV